MKMPKLEKWQMVVIRWLDCWHVQGWQTESEVDLSLYETEAEFETAGMFFEQRKNFFVIVQSRNFSEEREGQKIGELIMIPVSCILSVKRLATTRP